MTFSGGGSNVKGTQQIEVGTLTYDTTSNTPGGTGTVNHDYTVPAGHKWILKQTNATFVGFTGTSNVCLTSVSPDGTNFIIVDSESTINTNGTVYPFVNTKTSILTLPAGAKVRVAFGIDAYTSGDVKSEILYQDVIV